MSQSNAVPDVIEVLADLISINSENPGGSEREIVAYCSDLLARHAIDTQVESARPDRPNLIARLEGGLGRKLIFQSHLDTKPAYHAGASEADWSRPPFKATRVGPLLYGLGACDTKGGAAAQLVALIRHASQWSRDLPTLEWQGVADEENGSLHGAEHLLETGALAADFAVVAEPTNGRVSLEQMGSTWVEIDVTGEQCHGGMPWLGADAIAAALDLVDRMKSAVARRPRNDRIRHHPQVGIRILEGGGHAGTVAGHCRLVSDIRVSPGDEQADYRRLWEACADETSAAFGVTIRIAAAAGGGCQPHWLGDAMLRRTIELAWSDEFGEALAPDFFYGGSDARYFARAGTPAIVFGAGDLAHAHAPDEFVPVDEVMRCEQFLFRLPTALAAAWRQGGIG